jgi:hypothetical protein
MDRRRVTNDKLYNTGNKAHNMSLSAKMAPWFLSFRFSSIQFYEPQSELSAKLGLQFPKLIK